MTPPLLCEIAANELAVVLLKQGSLELALESHWVPLAIPGLKIDEDLTRVAWGCVACAKHVPVTVGAGDSGTAFDSVRKGQDLVDAIDTLLRSIGVALEIRDV